MINFTYPGDKVGRTKTTLYNRVKSQCFVIPLNGHCRLKILYNTHNDIINKIPVLSPEDENIIDDLPRRINELERGLINTWIRHPKNAGDKKATLWVQSGKKCRNHKQQCQHCEKKTWCC